MQKYQIKKNPKKLWFKAKKYGWGWYPSTWEGWAVMLVFVFFMFVGALFIEQHSKETFAYFYVIYVFILTGILIFICYKKGEKPRWRWGD